MGGLGLPDPPPPPPPRLSSSCRGCGMAWLQFCWLWREGPRDGGQGHGGPAVGGGGRGLCHHGGCPEARPRHAGAQRPGVGACSWGAWVPALCWCKGRGNGVGGSGGSRRGLGAVQEPLVGAGGAAGRCRYCQQQPRGWWAPYGVSSGARKASGTGTEARAAAIPHAAGCTGSSAGTDARHARASWGEAGAEAKCGEGGELHSRQPSRGTPARGLLGFGALRGCGAGSAGAAWKTAGWESPVYHGPGSAGMGKTRLPVFPGSGHLL